MKQALLAATLLLAPIATSAQQAPDVVLVPRSAVEAAVNAIAHPAPTSENVVELADALRACLSVQPRGGVMQGSQATCPDVWQAEKAREAKQAKAIADAKKAAKRAAQKAAEERAASASGDRPATISGPPLQPSQAPAPPAN